MFAVHHRRSYGDLINKSVIATGLETVEAAQMKRVVCGDIVVWECSGEVVWEDTNWLFDWEKRQLLNPSSYPSKSSAVLAIINKL